MSGYAKSLAWRVAIPPWVEGQSVVYHSLKHAMWLGVL